MWILVVIGIFFAIVIIRAYLNSNYKSYKDAEKTIEYSKSEILVEEIEEKDGMFWVKFTYKVAGRKFPIEKLDVANTREEANRILEKYKLEFNTAPKEMVVKNRGKDHTYIPKTMIWGFILIGIQIIYNAMLMVKLDADIGYAIGYTVGAHALTIIAVFLFYKAYKDK